MAKLFLLSFLMLFSMTMSAQSAEKLYEEGKKLFDAEKYEQAVPMLQAAADKGHKKAQYRLGRCYDKGYSVKEDKKKALQSLSDHLFNE